MKKSKKEVKGKNYFVVFCFFMAIHFPSRVRVLVVPVRLESGVGVVKDGIWFVLTFVSLSPSAPFPVRKLARAA